jgi:hypothetical protein
MRHFKPLVCIFRFVFSLLSKAKYSFGKLRCDSLGYIESERMSKQDMYWLELAFEVWAMGLKINAASQA